MKRVFMLIAGMLSFCAHAYAGNGDLTVTGNITAAGVTAPVTGNATSATSLVTSRGIISTNESSTYGNLQASGTKGGYFGIRSSDYGRTFMYNAVASGIYKDSGAWAWYFDDNGVLQTGTVPGASVTGTVANATNATNATNLNNQPASYYQPASTAITTSNIGVQSVSYATNAGSATNAGMLNSQPGSYYQPASTAITTANIVNQNVNSAGIIANTILSSAAASISITGLDGNAHEIYEIIIIGKRASQGLNELRLRFNNDLNP